MLTTLALARVAAERCAQRRCASTRVLSLALFGLVAACSNGASPPANDAQVDAASHADSSDTTRDVARDATPDVARDATPDVTLDATTDVALDATPDATPDVALDATLDVTLDVTPDAVISIVDSSLVRPDDVPPFSVGVATLAGTGEPGFADGLRDEARFNNPVNVAVSPTGEVYIADFGNDAIRRIEPDGWVTTYLHSVGFEAPFGMAFASDGTFYVETDANDRGARSESTGTVWRLAPGATSLTVVARDIGRPRGLVVLPDGRVVMSDYAAHVIAVLDPADGAVTVLAGTRGAAGFVDGPGAEARFNRPYGVARRTDGAILVADQVNQRIRVVTMDGAVSTLAGSGARGSADGAGEAASFDGPQGVAIDSEDALYVSESGGHVVRRIDVDGVVSTVAGDGREGYLDGELRAAQFFGLEGLAISPDGATGYLPDGNRGGAEPYHRVRRMTLR